MKFYKFLSKEEREHLSDSFLILRKTFRNNKDRLPKKNHKEIKELISHMAETLYINIDDNLQDFRVERLNKKYSQSKA